VPTLVERRRRDLLRGKDVHNVGELRRQGLSIQAIGSMTGFDRKTVRKYLRGAEGTPVYGPRPRRPSKLDPYKPYLEERLGAGVWNARVLWRELRQRGYAGGYTILTDWLRPQREAGRVAAVRRFETPPGQQVPVDWGHVGDVEIRRLGAPAVGFHLHAGLQPDNDGRGGAGAEARQAVAAARRGVPAVGWGAAGDPLRPDEDRLAGDRRARRDRLEPGVCRLGALLGLRAAAVPAEAPFGPGPDEGQGGVGREVRAAELPVRAAGARTGHRRGSERPVAPVGLGSGQPAGARDDARTGDSPLGGRLALEPLDGRPPYPYAGEELRQVARDAFVHWQGSRCSVPWIYTGKPVWVRQQAGRVEVRHGADCIADHPLARRQHLVVIEP
jgi:hypothetical protein